MRHATGPRLNARVADAARGGLVDAQVLLHRRRRAADLPAGLPVAEQNVERGLNRIGLAAVARALVAGESRERAPFAPMAREQRGSPLRREPADSIDATGRYDKSHRPPSVPGARRAEARDGWSRAKRPRRSRSGCGRSACSRSSSSPAPKMPCRLPRRSSRAASLRRDHAAHARGGRRDRRRPRRVPDILLGAGTVLSIEQLEIARRGGRRLRGRAGHQPARRRGEPRARLADAPGRRDAQRDRDRRERSACAPLKLFPAELLGGAAYIARALRALSRHRIRAHGLDHAGDAPGYLALPQVVACGGSWMVKPALVAAGSFDRSRSSPRTPSSTYMPFGRKVRHNMGVVPGRARQVLGAYLDTAWHHAHVVNASRKPQTPSDLAVAQPAAVGAQRLARHEPALVRRAGSARPR